MEVRPASDGGHLNGFCLISSDSDFTRLATRIREAGLSVYGFGERKTPLAFVAACDKFVYTEILRAPQQAATTEEPPESGPKKADGKAAVPEPTPDGTELKRKLAVAVESAAQEDGWAILSAVGGILLKNDPAFDPRNYGVPKLGELVRRQEYLEVKVVPAKGAPGGGHLHVRLKALAPTRPAP